MPIGETVVIKGELSAQEDLTIFGTVEGSIAVESHLLDLREHARIRARITAGTVIVGGTVEGEIAATSRVEVRATGTLEGKVTTPAIAVADGAQVQGRIETPSNKSERRRRLQVAV